MKKSSHLGNVFEGFLLIIIILSIMHIFFEDFVILKNFDTTIRKYLILAGLAFDAVFSIEFVIRMLVSAAKKRTNTYLADEGGIVDLVSSIPLLLFYSGPLAYITFFMGKPLHLFSLGGMGFLPLMRIMRAVRVLRFIRTLKIFGKLKPKYAMTPKLISPVLTITISLIVASLIGFYYFESGKVIQSRFTEVERIVKNFLENPIKKDLKNFLKDTQTLLFIKQEEVYLYQGMSLESFKTQYLHDDYGIENLGGYEFYFSNKDVNKIYASVHLLVFSMITGTIITTLLFYRRYLNKHISNVTLVMLKGFKSAHYSVPIRIDEKRSEFEIYRLADQYNRKWLPIKRRIIELKKNHG